MSSGNYTSPGLGFNNTGGGSTGNGPACATARYEPRGSGILFVGLCRLCGRATTRRNPAGQPEHDQVPALAWTWDAVLADLAWNWPANTTTTTTGSAA